MPIRPATREEFEAARARAAAELAELQGRPVRDESREREVEASIEMLDGMLARLSGDGGKMPP